MNTKLFFKKRPISKPAGMVVFTLQISNTAKLNSFNFQYWHKHDIFWQDFLLCIEYTFLISLYLIFKAFYYLVIHRYLER